MIKIYASLLFVFFFKIQANSQCSIGPTAIPDQGSATYTFNNQSISNWADFKVQINFSPSHSWAGDLRAQITVSGCATGNGTYTLFNFQTNNLGSSCDMNGTYTFLQTGSSFLSTNGGGASNPIPACVSGAIPAGTYTSAQQWPTSGSCSGGTITATISDNQANDVASALVNLSGTSNCFLLPVGILYFNGVASEQGNLLTWATVSEYNSGYFTVEYSNDMQQWLEAGKVTAAGNSSIKKEYNFNHLGVNARRIYYRLRQTDLDGRLQYSKIIVIEGSKGQGDAITVFPNPNTGSDINLFINSTKRYKAEVSVAEMTGKKIYTTNIFLHKGNNSLKIDGSKFQRGIYIIAVSEEKLIRHQTKLVLP